MSGKGTSQHVARCAVGHCRRDIDALEARGIFKKDAAGARSTSYSLVIDD